LDLVECIEVCEYCLRQRHNLKRPMEKYFLSRRSRCNLVPPIEENPAPRAVQLCSAYRRLQHQNMARLLKMLLGIVGGRRTVAAVSERLHMELRAVGFVGVLSGKAYHNRNRSSKP
jgi:hypothetical protein